MLGYRTDLAMEAHLLARARAGGEALPGVAVSREEGPFPVTRVEVLDRRGQEALGKPRGST